MTYESKEELETIIANDRTEGWSVPKFLAQCSLEIITKGSMGYTGRNINDSCPHVHPMGAEEFLKKWWAKA